MDKVEMLAKFEKIAERENLEGDEFRLFLLFLANYDNRRRCGMIRLGTISAALGRDFVVNRLDQACYRLFSLGLVRIISYSAVGTVEDESIMVYGMQHLT